MSERSLLVSNSLEHRGIDFKSVILGLTLPGSIAARSQRALSSATFFTPLLVKVLLLSWKEVDLETWLDAMSS